MNPRGAAGRPSERSSFLGHPGATFLAKNERELRTREKPRPGGTYALSIGRFTGRGSGGGMNRTTQGGEPEERLAPKCVAHSPRDRHDGEGNLDFPDGG